MIKTIIVDLDGTVLDGKIRHYECYRHILELNGFNPLSIQEYWQIKRQRIDLFNHLRTIGAESIHDAFKKIWLELIEKPEYLSMDVIQPGARKKLRHWHNQGILLVLATLRHNKKALLDQLSALQIDSIFDHLLVCEHIEGGKGKAEQVRKLFPNLKSEDVIWVGDSEVDIEAARTLGCRMWAVSSGIREESILLSMLPDFLSFFLADIDLKMCS